MKKKPGEDVLDYWERKLYQEEMRVLHPCPKCLGTGLAKSSNKIPCIWCEGKGYKEQL